MLGKGHSLGYRFEMRELKDRCELENLMGTTVELEDVEKERLFVGLIL